MKTLDEFQLRQFTGTNEWHRWSVLFPKFTLTDGAKYVADSAGAYWLMDLIGSAQLVAKVKREEFQVWTLKKVGESHVVVTCEDGNGHKVYKQDIPYTDFPINSITLWFMDGVIMLPSEY